MSMQSSFIASTAKRFNAPSALSKKESWLQIGDIVFPEIHGDRGNSDRSNSARRLFRKDRDAEDAYLLLIELGELSSTQVTAEDLIGNVGPSLLLYRKPYKTPKAGESTKINSA